MCIGGGGFNPASLIAPTDPVGQAVMSKMPEPIQQVTDLPAKAIGGIMGDSSEPSKVLQSAANPTSQNAPYKSLLGG